MNPFEKYTTCTIQLQEAIFTNNKLKILECLKTLIHHQVKVEVIIKDIRYPCYCHQYFTGTLDAFSAENIIFPAFCPNNHTICLTCTILFVKNSFSSFYLQNCYQCPGCLLINNSSGSRLFSDDLLEDSLRFCVGENAVNNAKLEVPETPEFVSMHKKCIACKSKVKVFEICENGDNFCKECLINWTKSKHRWLKCINKKCSGAMIFKKLISILKDTDALYYINPELAASNIRIHFCKSCKFMLEIKTRSDSTLCSCGSRICNQCYELDHFGLTCFYQISTKEYEKIVLRPPRNPSFPRTLLDHEYQRVKYAFNYFVKGRFLFVGATLIVNKPLEERYSDKKNEMAKQCGGRKKVNEVLIWHGSRFQNYEVIMQEGLKVGGVDVPIANAAVHGYGIYAATNPDTPIVYSAGCGYIIGCLAMKGNDNKNAIKDTAKLNNGVTHSHAVPPDWVIFFTKEQVLPRYLVQFQAC